MVARRGRSRYEIGRSCTRSMFVIYNRPYSNMRSNVVQVNSEDYEQAQDESVGMAYFVWRGIMQRQDTLFQ